MLNPLPVVLADLRKSRAGVLAVVLLIALAVAFGVAVSAQERALRKGSARAAENFDIVVGAPGSETQLVLTTVYLRPAALGLIDGSWLAKLQADPGVTLAAPIAFGDFHRGVPLVGTTAGFAALAGAPAEGRPFAMATEALVGADVPLPLGYRFKPRHGQEVDLDDDDDDHDPAHGDHGHADHGHADHGRADHGHGDAHIHQELEYTVVGRLPPQGTPWDRAILVPVEAVWWVHGLPDGHSADKGITDPRRLTVGDRFDAEALSGVPAVVVRARAVADAYRLRGALRGKETMAVFPAEVLVDLYATLGDARTILSALAVATQGLVVAAVLLAVFASLDSRRRPLAVLRALGASRAYVFAAVWLHVTLMVLAGAALGLPLGWGAAHAVSALFAERTGLTLPVAVGGTEVAMVAALVLVGGLLALIPAAAVYRQPAAAGLRG